MSIRSRIKENKDLEIFLKSRRIRIYLFGSSLYSFFPRDLDLLIVYNKEFISNKEIREFKNKFQEYLHSNIGIVIDITYLTNREELETNFIKCENAKIVKL